MPFRLTFCGYTKLTPRPCATAHIKCEREARATSCRGGNLSAVRCGEGHTFFSPPRVRTSEARAQRPSTAAEGEERSVSAAC